MAEKVHYGPIHPHATAPIIAKLFADLKTFGQLEERIVALPNERARGAAFEVFAEAWLATQRLSQARNLWPADSVPSGVQSKLHLPLKDMGVDGVFDTALDENVCYQAKFRSGRPSLVDRNRHVFRFSRFCGSATSVHELR
jgi:predicted helicase